MGNGNSNGRIKMTKGTEVRNQRCIQIPVISLELSDRTFTDDGYISLLCNMVATSHMWPWHTLHVANTTKELDLSFNFSQFKLK